MTWCFQKIGEVQSYLSTAVAELGHRCQTNSYSVSLPDWTQYWHNRYFQLMRALETSSTVTGCAWRKSGSGWEKTDSWLRGVKVNKWIGEFGAKRAGNTKRFRADLSSSCSKRSQPYPHMDGGTWRILTIDSIWCPLVIFWYLETTCGVVYYDCAVAKMVAGTWTWVMIICQNIHFLSFFSPSTSFSLTHSLSLVSLFFASVILLVSFFHAHAHIIQPVLKGERSI